MNNTLYELLISFPEKEGLVFKGRRGGEANSGYISGQFRKAIRDAKLDRRIHFHSLRHTFASLLVRKGVSLYQVQKLLGHTTSRITEIYAHLRNEELHSVVNQLSA